MRRSVFFPIILGSFLMTGASHALEPVNPQPATPLTFENPAYHKVIPSEAIKMIQDGVVVIDVRNPIERIKEGFIKGSVNVPLPTLKVGAKINAAPDFEQKILVHCRSGVRAENASKILVATGYKNVYNMYGILQWPYGLENAQKK